jgi:probable rRNA maturation factor
MPIAREDLRLELQLADPSHRRWLPRHRDARWMRAALDAPAEFTMRVVGADEGRALNRDFRGKDYATNVLTFVYDIGSAGAEAARREPPKVAADLVLCAPVVAREAREQGIPLEAHYAHLVVHGTLHARGFDHEDDPSAREMEARESAILTALGFADPYAA